MSLFRTDGGNATSSGLDLSDPEISSGWERVRDDEDDASILLLSYASKNKLKVESVASGTAETIVSLMNDSSVWFGGLKSANGKLYAVYCVGSDTGGMVRARAGLHKNAVVNALDGTVGEISGMSVEEFAESLQAIEESI